MYKVLNKNIIEKEISPYFSKLNKRCYCLFRENFVNYNVIGSPSFYLIDVEGKLLGMYFNTKDLERDL